MAIFQRCHAVSRHLDQRAFAWELPLVVVAGWVADGRGNRSTLGAEPNALELTHRDRRSGDVDVSWIISERSQIRSRRRSSNRFISKVSSTPIPEVYVWHVAAVKLGSGSGRWLYLSAHL